MEHVKTGGVGGVMRKQVKNQSETWKTFSQQSISDQSSVCVSDLRGSCAGVPSCTLPLRAAFGLTEDTGGPRSAVGPRPPPHTFVTLQGDAQVLHHGAQSYGLPKTRQSRRKKNKKTIFRHQ